MAIQVICFFLGQLWSFVPFKKFAHFIKVITFSIKNILYFFIMLLIATRICSDVPLSIPNTDKLWPSLLLPPAQSQKMRLSPAESLYIVSW